MCYFVTFVTFTSYLSPILKPYASAICIVFWGFIIFFCIFCTKYLHNSISSSYLCTGFENHPNGHSSQEAL